MQKFPNDDNGEALRNMAAQGDDLTKARVIDFSVIFGELKNAKRFSREIENLGLDVSVTEESDEEDFVDVTVRKLMVPTHSAISEFEATLEKISYPLGGQNDGWGCFAVKQ